MTSPLLTNSASTDQKSPNAFKTASSALNLPLGDPSRTSSYSTGHRNNLIHSNKSPESRHSSFSSATSQSLMGHLNPNIPTPMTDEPNSVSDILNPDVASDGEPVKKSSLLKKKKQPKAKFTAEDDDLLVELKEVRKLTWKQIAEHFVGRTAGALQVRYCTKLKARSVVWSAEDVEALHEAIREYEEERWAAVSQKMGNKFTASVCRDKYKMISRAI